MSSSRYARGTTVPPEKSRLEIEQLLDRYGATGFMYGWMNEKAMIAFEMRERHVRFLIPLDARPPANAQDKKLRAWEQSVRERWRSGVLIIKAKLEAVASGIVSFEQEWLPYIVLANGQTVADFAVPQIEAVYKGRKMPPMLPGVGGEAGGKP